MPIKVGSKLPLVESLQRAYVSQHGSDRLSLSRGSRPSLLSPNLDAATITFTDSLRARSSVLAQTSRSVSDAQSLLSVAESALHEIDSITTRLGELATTATDETLSQSQRQALQEESEALTREYNRIVETTEYKGTKILDQANDSLQINLGNGATGTITTPLISALARSTGSGTLTISQSLATVSNATDIILLDINGDGYQDLVATLTGRSELNVRFGSSDGTFAGITTVAGGGTTGGILAKGDIDNDGDEDIGRLGTPAGSETRIQIYNNTGTYPTLITDTQEKCTDYLSVDRTPDVYADLNLDGAPDVI
jgi:flagellin-like hook-associated protein FlgL